MAATGLKKSALRRIPVIIYGVAGIHLIATDCAICLGEFIGGEKVQFCPIVTMDFMLGALTHGWYHTPPVQLAGSHYLSNQQVLMPQKLKLGLDIREMMFLLLEITKLVDPALKVIQRQIKNKQKKGLSFSIV
jgi:hypothetical protein